MILVTKTIRKIRRDFIHFNEYNIQDIKSLAFLFSFQNLMSKNACVQLCLSLYDKIIRKRNVVYCIKLAGPRSRILHLINTEPLMKQTLHISDKKKLKSNNIIIHILTKSFEREIKITAEKKNTQ